MIYAISKEAMRISRKNSAASERKIEKVDNERDIKKFRFKVV